MNCHQNVLMDDDTRLAYLDAMGVVCWVAKADINDEKVDSLAKIIQDEDKQEVTSQRIVNLATPAVQQPDKLDEKKSKNDPVPAKVSTDEQPQHFLKLVNWQNQIIKEEGSKELLIICRHEIDQPAGSFAKGNAPSQFMMDYINTISAFNESNGFEVKIKLAHLTEAGLGKDCINFDDYLENAQVDMVLLLGDETLSQIVAEKTEVSAFRGRLVSLPKQYNALVSYHPFSLIQNPSLKSLALEDLAGLINYLAQGG